VYIKLNRPETKGVLQVILWVIALISRSRQDQVLFFMESLEPLFENSQMDLHGIQILKKQ